MLLRGAMCRLCSACYARFAGQMLFLLRQRLFAFPLRGGEAAHQKALAFMLTGRASAETLFLVELPNCSRQWSGISPNRLRHHAVCAGHLLLGRLLIYVLVCRQKSKTSHRRRDIIPHAAPKGHKYAQVL